MQTFSFPPPINIIEDGNWFLVVTSIEASNSVFNITNENNSSRIFIPGFWSCRVVQKLFTNYKNCWSLDLRMISNYMFKKLRK